jgi:hypothetical protein
VISAKGMTSTGGKVYSRIGNNRGTTNNLFPEDRDYKTRLPGFPGKDIPRPRETKILWRNSKISLGESRSVMGFENDADKTGKPRNWVAKT